MAVNSLRFLAKLVSFESIQFSFQLIKIIFVFSITWLSKNVSNFFVLFCKDHNYKEQLIRTTHFFSLRYKNNIECEWTIKASPGNEMAINIDMLDIDETEHCNGDYLEIREKNSAGKIIGVYCGKDIPSALPRTNTYWLKFRSDNDGVGNGFRLEYSYGNQI